MAKHIFKNVHLARCVCSLICLTIEGRQTSIGLKLKGLSKISPLVCRAPGRPGQRRTGTRCGMPGGHGASALGLAAVEPPTPSDDASAPSKDASHTVD